MSFLKKYFKNKMKNYIFFFVFAQLLWLNVVVRAYYLLNNKPTLLEKQINALKVKESFEEVAQEYLNKKQQENLPTNERQQQNVFIEQQDQENAEQQQIQEINEQLQQVDKTTQQQLIEAQKEDLQQDEQQDTAENNQSNLAQQKEAKLQQINKLKQQQHTHKSIRVKRQYRNVNYNDSDKYNWPAKIVKYQENLLQIEEKKSQEVDSLKQSQQHQNCTYEELQQSKPEQKQPALQQYPQENQLQKQLALQISKKAEKKLTQQKSQDDWLFAAINTQPPQQEFSQQTKTSFLV